MILLITHCVNEPMMIGVLGRCLSQVSDETIKLNALIERMVIYPLSHTNQY